MRWGLVFGVAYSLMVIASIWGCLIHLETKRDRDALRATVTALREGGDGSCAVKNNGPYVLCWMEDGRLKTAIAPVKLLKRRK